jgi:CspA family cold shock protein
MPTGTVKFFNETKGFGFITPDYDGTDDSTNELFVHVTGLLEVITEEDNVTFEVREDRKGKNAIKVQKT